MAPITWTTPEQQEFLEGRLQEFIAIVANKYAKGLKHASNKEITEFFCGLTGEWYTRWPECEALVEVGGLPLAASECSEDGFDWADDEYDRYQKAIVKRTKVCHSHVIVFWC